MYLYNFVIKLEKPVDALIEDVISYIYALSH